MLRIDERWLEVPVEHKDFLSIVRGIQSDTWVPAVATSRETFFKLASAPARYEQYVDPRLPPSTSRDLESTDVEIFFQPYALFMLQFAYALRWMRQAQPGSPDQRVLVMRVGPDGQGDHETEINEFAALVRAAIGSELDGRRVRHWSTEWHLPAAQTSLLDDLTTRLAIEEAPLSLKAAELDDKSVVASEVLADRRSRELLIEIAQAGFARAEDILSKRGKTRVDVADSLDALKTNGLIVTEHVLQCRKSSAPLVQLSDLSQLGEPSTGDLKCPHCGRRFSEESPSEGYTVSEVGRSLSRGSHWMTVWITQRLVELGVTTESVTWNLEETSEEVDLLFEHLGRLWIVELKDRDFGAGDAHPFNYRRVRYRADHAVIVSTGKISSDAKRVFAELERESDRRPNRARKSGASSTVFVEGLEQFLPTLRTSFDDASLDRVRTRLSVPSAAIGFDLADVAVSRS